MSAVDACAIRVVVWACKLLTWGGGGYWWAGGGPGAGAGVLKAVGAPPPNGCGCGGACCAQKHSNELLYRL